MFYWFLKWIAIGPVLRIVFRPVVEGADHVPEEGPAILASNHLSYADWLFMPLTLPRRVTFVAKAEYFTTPGIKGWFQKKFFSGSGQVPIDRSGASAAEGALSAAKRILDAGRAVRDLPRGHPLPRRQALPRQDRRRPARARDRRPGHPGRRPRHRRGGASGQEVRHLHPARSCGSASRSTSPATRGWRTTATSCARSPTRSCTRSCGSPARSTSTRTPRRAKEESKRLETEAKEAKGPGGGRTTRADEHRKAS